VITLARKQQFPTGKIPPMGKFQDFRGSWNADWQKETVGYYEY